MKQIKKVEIENEVVKQVMKTKKRVKGSFGYDEKTGKLSFTAYNISGKKVNTDKLIKLLTHGDLSHSVKRVKIWLSIPKKIGSFNICKVLSRETEIAKEAIMAENFQEKIY